MTSPLDARRALALGVAFALSLGVAWVGSQGAGLALKASQAYQAGALKLDPRYRRLMALGFREVQADLLWLRAGITFGEGVRSHQANAPELCELINQAVDLDPDYYDAYWYGASLLPPQEAVALLERGAQHFPLDWRLPEMEGFLYHVALHDYPRAARCYELAASRPGHPPYVPSLAGRLYSETDDLESAVRVLQNVYDTCRRRDLKEDFGRRIQQLENIRRLTAACATYRAGLKRAPRRLEDLITVGLIPALPSDPYGGHYYLTGRGRVACDADRNGLRG